MPPGPESSSRSPLDTPSGDEFNPYAAPESAGKAGESPGIGRDRFPDLSARQLKMYLDCHESIRAMAMLWLAGGIILGSGAALGAIRGALADAPLLVIVPATAALVQIAASVGSYRFTHGGRALGIVACVLMIVALPLAVLADGLAIVILPMERFGFVGFIVSLVGVLALIAFARGRPLFGPQRLQKREIAEELAYRRRNRID